MAQAEKAKILIVDDEEAVRKVISRMLEAKGFETETANGVDNALEILAIDQFDIVLTDHQMEGKTGLDLIIETNRLYPYIEKILLTGYGDKELYRDIINRGAVFSVLEKPTDSSVLLSTMDRALKHRLRRLEEIEETDRLRTKYHDIFAHTTDLIQCFDSSGSFIYVNPAWHAALGYSNEEILRMSIGDIIKDDEQDAFSVLTNKMWNSGSVGTFETIFSASDGHDIFIEGSGTVQRNEGVISTVTCILRDVTERKRATDEIRSRLREETMIARIAELLATTDEPKNVYTDILSIIGNAVYSSGAYIFAINEIEKEIEKVAHWFAEERPFDERFRKVPFAGIPSEQWDLLINGVNQIDNTEHLPSDQKELFERHNFNSILTIPIAISSCAAGILVLTAGEKINSWEKNVVKMLKAASDIIANAWTRQIEIDARKQKEKEAEQSQVLVIRADRLAALGTMAAGIIHEITQPLNAINISAQTIAYGSTRGWTLDSDKVTNSLTLITDQVQRMNEIVTNIRAFARDGMSVPRQMESMNIQVDRVLSMLSEQMRSHDIEIIKEYSDIPEVTMNTQQILQVIINLVTNARQAIDEHLASERKITIVTRADDTNVYLDVSDTGPGIPETIIDKIFDPFFTTKEIGKGTGLGLSISAGIIQDHNGRLRVNNSGQDGASFTVQLPRDNREKE